MRTIAIVNQKGGCGKTTTAINLAALYAKRGLRTLLVDMDPQSHCAAGLGVPESRIEYSIGDALLADHNGTFDSSALIWEVARNLHLAPSTVMLSALEAPGGGLHQLPDKDRRLENLLACMANQFDRCLIDCPPTIGLLTFNALRAAREALIPVETGFFSLRGAEKQWNTIQRMITHIGRPIACHLLPTLHNPQSQLACNILAALRRQFAGQILPIVIHEDEALREAASFGQPVLEYAPQSQALKDFEQLADWLEEHAANPAVFIEVLAQHDLLNPASTAAMEARQTTPPSSGAGGRAAELARRVHNLTGRNASEQHTSAIHRDSQPNSQREHVVAAAAAPTQTPTSTPTPAPMPTSPHQTHDALTLHAEQETFTINPELMPPIAPIVDVITGQKDGGTTLADGTKLGAGGQTLGVGGTTLRVVDRAGGTTLRVVDRPGGTTLRVVEPQTQHHPTTPAPDLSHLYGVRLTSRGVLFIQPASTGRALSIAGDFNQWSATSTPMRLDEQTGVFQAIVPLPAGMYQYRIVVDGEWIPDPHNPDTHLNSYGEPNSVFVVL